jgi:hypothetical protein
MAIRLVAMPALAQQLTLRGFMQEVAQVAGRPAEIGFYQTFDYGAVYYSQQHIARYQSLPAPLPRFLLVQRDRWQAASGELSAYEAVPLSQQRELVLLRRGEQP